jgi:O-antigen/teichoic acid export membrane protein
MASTPDPAASQALDPTTSEDPTAVADPAPVAGVSTQEEAPAQGLRATLLRGSAFEMLGYGLSQLVRFGSNLVLTRMLIPEAFGLAALVNILNQGLIMLSDVGLPTVIVQSEHGDELRFLNTAFSWQAMRALALAVAAIVFAIPMAYLYKEPELRRLIPFGAVSVLILGFRSTGYYTMRRRLNLAPIMYIEIGSQCAAVITMIIWAKIDPSVWALMGGAVMNSLGAVVGSHMLRVGYRNRFEWDKESAKSMFDFGKWVAGSSMLTFASQQGDRLMLGRFLGAATLGVYSIAVFLSAALGDAITRITQGVFFPAYSRVRGDGHERLQQVFYRTRLAVDALVLPALGGLAVLGPAVVRLLYDQRYNDAGWMLRVLAVRVAISALLAPYQFCLFAIGDSRYGFFLNLARTLALVVGVSVGYSMGGVAGLVWGITVSEVPALLVVGIGFARHRLLSIKHELRVPVFYASGVALGYGCLLLLRSLGLRV